MVAWNGVRRPGELSPGQPEQQEDQCGLADVFPVGMADEHVDDLGEREDEGEVEEQLDRVRREVLGLFWDDEATHRRES